MPGHVPPRRRRPRWGRIALVAAVALLVLALIGGGGLWIYANRLNGSLGRTDAFSQITGQHPHGGE
jgi:hypothetical protein